MQRQRSGTMNDLNQLILCSVCEEVFTCPKMLPCGDTFCYECVTVKADDKNQRVTCPICEQVHPIPGGRVSSFSENGILNKLLPVISNSGQKCSDCKKHPILAKCKHCDTEVCRNCFVEHQELLFDVRSKLNGLRDTITGNDCKPQLRRKTAHIAECIDHFTNELDQVRIAFQPKIDMLKAGQSQVENYLQTLIKIYKDLWNIARDKPNEKSYLSSLFVKLYECKTVAHFNALMNIIADMENVISTEKTEDQDFRVHFSAQNLDVSEFYSIQLGQSVVDIKGNYNQICQQPGQQQAPTASGGTSSNASAGLSIEENMDTSMLQFGRKLLPKGVNYHEMGKPPRLPTIINDDLNYMGSPQTCAYDHFAGDLYFDDGEDIRIFDRNFVSKRLLQNEKAVDLSVSKSSLYLITPDSIRQILLRDDGGATYTLPSRRKAETEVPLGALTGCCAVVAYKDYVAVLEKQFRCVMIFDKNLQYKRQVGRNFLNSPCALAMASDGTLYVADGVESCVHVFTFDGQMVQTFGQLRVNGDVAGVAVDGDGFVCVARRTSNRIDVYDPRCRRVHQIGGPSKQPGHFNFCGFCKLLFLPDGRLMVCDSGNNRMQIL